MDAARVAHSLGLLTVIAVTAAAGEPAYWPQFRGPNASGVAADGDSPPVEFGPEKNVVWKVAIPSGASSPCVWGDRIFLTAFVKDENRLETLCLDRGTGEILWRRDAPASEIEKSHAAGSPASATPAANADRVVAYFGSFGLLCYDHEGTELWKRPTSMPQRRFGTGTSPILAGDLVLLARDENPDGQLLALDVETGEVRWMQPLPSSGGPGTSEGYATPVVVGDQVVLHRTGEVAAFGLEDGGRRWQIGAFSSACSTPVLVDGTVYVATWNNFGEPDLRAKLPAFDELAKKHDADGDGLLSKDEFPADLALSHRPGAGEGQGGEVLVVWFFDRIDLNKDGRLSTLEWAAAFTLVQLMTSSSEHGLVAVRLEDGGAGAAKVAWREKRYVPEVPSPLAYRGRIYMVKDGGIVTCLDAATGKLLYRKRLGAGGSYFASPIAADGRVYAASHNGVVTVLADGAEFSVLARNDLGESVTATPAVVGDAIYVRTAGHVWAFGTP